MTYKTLSDIHTKAMRDPEHRAAYEAEETAEQLRDTLAQWRNETLNRYARPCGVHFQIQQI